jgi:amino acid transporter
MDSSSIKEFLIGKPFPTSMEMHERLDKVRALAVFASDPISSNAYATEAIMSVLVVLGSQALYLTWPVGLAVAALVLMVVFSYIQTIMHYPDGGGAYTVTKDNLGTMPSLIAAAALLTDYLLTVSVSVAAGVRAVTSAFPEVLPYRVILGLLAILIITWLNLRGVRESGTVFAVPTYAFVGGVILVIIIGLIRYTGLFGAPPIVVEEPVVPPSESLAGLALIWLILRAFAGGCTALTGIEAISNGVQAFKPPESKNAAETMVSMGVIAMTLFIGITFLSTHIGLEPGETESILSQLTHAVTGSGIVYYWVQFFTAMILFLAANTAYQDFPRLSSFLAKDNFMPRWMTNRGDRLVFSSGILVLAALASVVMVIFRADEIAMLPLYAIGVMLCFSLSQAGMVVLMGRIAHLKPGESIHTKVTEIHYEKGVHWKRFVNVIGSTVTFVVFLILLTTKFKDGAWIVALVIPALVAMFLVIDRHYKNVSQALSTKALSADDIINVANVVIVPIADIHRGVLKALIYAKRLSHDVRAVCITTSPEMKERLIMRWNRFPNITGDIQLITIDYDYRDILSPLVDYIVEVNTIEFPDLITTVVVPEFVPTNRIFRMLHNQTANRLRLRLRMYKDIVIIDVPYHIDEVFVHLPAPHLSDVLGNGTKKRVEAEHLPDSNLDEPTDPESADVAPDG